MVHTAPRWLGVLAAIAVLAVASAAMAAVPPLKTAAERQASLREQAAGKTIDISVTVTAGELTSHTKSGVAVGADTSLAFGGDTPLVWKVLSALIVSDSPITALQKYTGRLDASTAAIETLDEGFVYVWGNTPQVALSRDLSRIRRVTLRTDDRSWEFRLSGELGVAGLPQRIHILRSGDPYASVELEKTPSVKQD